MTTKIYVASSWRNGHQQNVVAALRGIGFEVYDFKNPNGEDGFKWSNIDPDWQNWSMVQYRAMLKVRYAQFGCKRDFDAMQKADICVLCLPCGRSAHLEAGWMKGAGKKVIAYIPDGERIEPELMYGIIDNVAVGWEELMRIVVGKTFGNIKEGDTVYVTVNSNVVEETVLYAKHYEDGNSVIRITDKNSKEPKGVFEFHTPSDWKQHIAFDDTCLVFVSEEKAWNFKIDLAVQAVMQAKDRQRMCYESLLALCQNRGVNVSDVLGGRKDE